MEQLLAALGSRVFLMNNVHDETPEVFETRWCLSYLRGPMTRTHIKALMDPRKAALPPAAPAPVRAAPSPALAEGASEEPCEMLALAQVRFTDSRRRIDFTRDVLVRAPVEHGVIRWQDAREEEQVSHTAGAPPPKNAERDLINWLYSHQELALFRSTALGETSRPGESERDFRIHLQQLAHEKRDLEVAKLRAKYAPKMAALEDKISRAEQAVEREKAQQQAETVSSAVNIGSTLLGALFGRKVARSAASSVRSVSKSRKEAMDARLAADTLERLRQQLTDLQQAFDADAQALASALNPMNEPLEPIAIRPKKAGIAVRLVTLVPA